MATESQPEVDEDFCTGCSVCVETCDPAALAVDGAVAVLARPEDCSGCGECVTACPVDGAIQMAPTTESASSASG